MRTLLLISCVFLLTIGCKSKVSSVPTGTILKEIEVADAKILIAENKDLIILDVRTPEETAEGTIPGAMTINLHDPDFDKKIGILNKEKPYLVYCRKGSRSTQATNKMLEAGFKEIYNLEGGYLAWSE